MISRSVIHDDDVFQLSLFTDGSDLFVLLSRRHEGDTRLGIPQDEETLVAGLGRVNRNVHGAQQKTGEIGNRPFRTILAQQDNPIALLDSPGLQLPRCGINPAAQLKRGDIFPGALLMAKHHAVGVALQHGEEDIVEGPKIHGRYVVRIPFRKISTTTSATFESWYSWSLNTQRGHHLVERTEEAVRGELVRHAGRKMPLACPSVMASRTSPRYSTI